MRSTLWILAVGLPLVGPLAAYAAAHVSVEQVRDIAFAKGIDLIDEIELDDGIWEVEGHDKTGHKIKIEVDAVSGEIIKIKRR